MSSLEKRDAILRGHNEIIREQKTQLYVQKNSRTKKEQADEKEKLGTEESESEEERVITLKHKEARCVAPGFFVDSPKLPEV